MSTNITTKLNKFDLFKIRYIFRRELMHMNIDKIKEAVIEYGTPLYIYDLKIIESQFLKLKKALRGIDNYEIYFAIKALTNVSILKFINKLGAGIETSSIEEVMVGLKSGFKEDRILYTPNGVSISEIEIAEKLNVKINLDSIESVKDYSQKFGNKSISVRINPNIKAGINKNVIVGKSDSKFGIIEDKINELIKLENEKRITINGLHIHTGSDIQQNDELERGIKKIFSIAEKFKNLKKINFGGGLKVEYYDGDTKTDLDNYVRVIKNEYHNYCKKTKNKLIFLFEPGKFLVSESGVFVTKINYLKESKNKKFIQINSGFNHLIRPTLYGSFHDIINISNIAGKKFEYDITGYICEKDTFAEKRMIAEASIGDLICFKNAGAYCFSMSSNYNSRVKPAEVCIYNQKIHMIRKRETIDDILKNQIDIFNKNL
jgi:diaminopimelate decarboxylase